MGHLYGDKLIIEISSILKNAVIYIAFIELEEISL